MKKRLIILLTILTLIFAVGALGCSNDNSVDNRKTVTVKTNFDDIVLNGAGKYDANSDVMLSVSYNPNKYWFLGWVTDNDLVSISSTYNFKMWDKDVTLEANFAKIPEAYLQNGGLNNDYMFEENNLLTVQSYTPNYGQVNVDNAGNVIKASKMVKSSTNVKVVSLTTSANRFLGWYDINDNLITTNAVFCFSMPCFEYIVYAKWNCEELHKAGTCNYCGFNQEIFNTYTDSNTTLEKYNLNSKEYRIADGVKKIKKGAFDNAQSLEVLYIPSSVTDIEQNAFDNCVSLKEISVDSSNKKYCSVEGNLYSKNETQLVKYCPNSQQSTYILLDNTETIESGAFYNCKNLKTLVLHESIYTISETAFYGNSIETIYMPTKAIRFIPKEGLKFVEITSGYEIAENSFKDCSLLENVVLSGSISRIGNNAFENCISLQSATIPNTVSYIGENAFKDCGNLTLYCVAQNKPSGWNANWNSSNCNVVWSYKMPSKGLSYTLNSDKESYTLTGKGTCSATEIVISSTYNGLPVTSIGNNAFYGYTSLKSVIVPDGIINIGEKAFSSCYNLTNLTISNTVTNIGSFAFSGCSKLANVIIPDSVLEIGNSAFSFCTSLTSIMLGNNVTSIGNEAFANCTSLCDVTIGAGVSNLGVEAFYHCPIETASIPAAACYTIRSSKLKRVEITSGTTIPSNAFSECISLQSVTIGESITGISYDAFVDCVKLIEVINKSSNIKVEKGSAANGFLGYYAISVFNSNDTYVNLFDTDDNGFITYTDGSDVILVGCTYNPTNISFPSHITKIHNYAFYNNNSLNSITIPNSVVSIGSFAFYGCKSLSKIIMANSVTSIGEDAFYCSSRNKNQSYEVYYQGTIDEWVQIEFESFGSNPTYTEFSSEYKSFYIPVNSVYRSVREVNITSATKINDFAFYGNSNLIEVTIGDSVTSIGQSAFRDCDSLTSITIGNGVTSIGSSAFSDCNSLTSVTIGDSLTSIGEGAFYYCFKLTSIKYCGTESQWGNIGKGSYWDSDTGHYTITYNYTGK